MRVIRRFVAAGLVVTLTCSLSIVIPALGTSATAVERDVVVWVPKGFKKSASNALPATIEDKRVRVLVKDLSNLEERLLTGDPKDSPDIVLIDASRTGDLAAAGLLSPIELKSSTRRALSPPAVDGFRYGFNTYGVPVQTQNVALVTNADLVPDAPKTFRKLRRIALALEGDGSVTMPLALGHDPSGAAVEAIYPLFSGLGGFAFGTNAGGSLDPTKVGINNSAFKKNSDRIDVWNQTGLIDSSITSQQAREAFLSGQAPFWITGPQDISALTEVDFRYRISEVPPVVKGHATAPLVSSRGFAVTAVARQHGVLDEARTVVEEVIPGAKSQRAFFDSSPIVGLPANKNTASKIENRQLVAFGAAGQSGVAYPNIEQWSRASIALLGAWKQSTRGADAEPAAVPAATAFAAARAAVREGSA